MIGYLSANGMNKVFEQWAQYDPNVTQYGYGQLYNENGEPKPKQVYPALWINPVSTDVGKLTITRTYQVLIYDLVYDKDGVTNQNNVISDCEELSFRLIRFLRNKSDIFDIKDDPRITPFTDKWLDDLSGVIIDISVEFNGESSYCEDPDYSFPITINEI